MLNVTHSRLGLNLNDTARGLKSVATLLGNDNFNLSIKAKIIFRDLTKDAFHLMYNKANSIQPFPFLEL